MKLIYLYFLFINYIFATATCNPSQYGIKVRVFPLANAKGMVTSVFVNDMPEYNYLKGQEFCDLCMNTTGADCSGFIFDNNISSESIETCFSTPGNNFFKKKEAIKLTLNDFTMVDKPNKICKIRHQDMYFKECVFFFDTACKALPPLNTPHPCNDQVYYSSGAGGGSGNYNFSKTHKPNNEYLFRFYNCPAAGVHYKPTCPTGKPWNAVLPGDPACKFVDED